MEQYKFAFQQSLKKELPQSIQELITAAEQVTERAYAPYSHFKVGAALLLDDGSIVTGANQENAAPSASICAERAALSNLNMNDKSQKVKAIAISYKGKSTDIKPLSPCGTCRQYMLEVQQQQETPIAVYMSSPGGHVVEIEDVCYLLPFYFSNTYLGEPTE